MTQVASDSEAVRVTLLGVRPRSGWQPILLGARIRDDLNFF